MRGLFAAAALVGLAAGAAGQEAVTFKQYAFKAGDKTRTTKTEDPTTATTVVAMGQEQKKNERKKKTVVYTTEVLEVGPDPAKPAKLRRTYEKATEERDGTEAKLPLDGRTVVVEKTGEKFTFTQADGTALAGKAAADLEQEFNKKGNFGDNIFPRTAVKPGDSWDLTEKFLAEMDTPDNPFVIAPKGAAVTGKLLKTTTKGATTFGDVEVIADLPLTELRGKLPLKLNPGSSWKIDMKAAGAMDGTSPEGGSTGTMRISVDGAVMGVALKVDSQVKMASRTERVPAGKP